MLDSQATRAVGVWLSDQSSTASEMASQTLSGWPSVTLSELHRNFGALWKLVVNFSSLSGYWNREDPDPSKGAQACLCPSARTPIRRPKVVGTQRNALSATTLGRGCGQGVFLPPGRRGRSRQRAQGQETSNRVSR